MNLCLDFSESTQVWLIIYPSEIICSRFLLVCMTQLFFSLNHLVKHILDPVVDCCSQKEELEWGSAKLGYFIALKKNTTITRVSNSSRFYNSKCHMLGTPSVLAKHWYCWPTLVYNYTQDQKQQLPALSHSQPLLLTLSQRSFVFLWLCNWTQVEFNLFRSSGGIDN